MSWYSDKAWYLHKLIPALLIGTAFPLVGYYVGWFVGASQTPVVATLIPLLVGLMGSVTVVLLERRGFATKFMDAVKKLQEKSELQLGAALKIESELGDAAETSFWVPALWSVNVMLFCLACYFGTDSGIAQRLGDPLPPLSKLLRQTDDPQERPTPDEYEKLHQLRWYLASKKYPLADVKSLFSEVINPLFDKSRALKNASQIDKIEAVVPVSNLLQDANGNPQPFKDQMEGPGKPTPEFPKIHPGKKKPPSDEIIIQWWLVSRPATLQTIVDRITKLNISPGDGVPLLPNRPPIPHL